MILLRTSFVRNLLAVGVTAVLCTLSMFTERRQVMRNNVEALFSIKSATVDDNDDDDDHRWWKGQFNTTYKNHPHLGAARHNQDNNNTTVGWIVDPSVARLATATPTNIIKQHDFVCPTNNNKVGMEGPGGYQVFQKVQKGLDRARQELLATNNNNNNATTNTTTTTPVRILCMVYTVHLPGAIENMQAIANTWGRRCDGLIGASNFTNHSMGVIDLVHAGPEAYANMWQKIRTMWTYVADHYLTEYDYFYICGDDTYVAVENLRVYLQGPQIRRLLDGYLDIFSNHSRHREQALNAIRTLEHRPLLLSAPMMYGGQIAIAGGSGYVLNRAAVQLFGEKGADSYQVNTVDSKEDIFMGRFMSAHGACLSDTRDEKGGNRFYMGVTWSHYFRGAPSPTRPRDLQRIYGLPIVGRMAAISEQQISFHLKDDTGPVLQQNHTIAELMYRYHAVLYHWCDGNNETLHA